MRKMASTHDLLKSLPDGTSTRLKECARSSAYYPHAPPVPSGGNGMLCRALCGLSKTIGSDADLMRSMHSHRPGALRRW